MKICICHSVTFSFNVHTRTLMSPITCFCYVVITTLRLTCILNIVNIATLILKCLSRCHNNPEGNMFLSRCHSNPGVNMFVTLS